MLETRAKDLNNLLDLLNGQHPRTKFSAELEVNGQLAFLDISKQDARTYALHDDLHHHPVQIREVERTLLAR